jgi:hypothetical protein
MLATNYSQNRGHNPALEQRLRDIQENEKNINYSARYYDEEYEYR